MLSSDKVCTQVPKQDVFLIWTKVAPLLQKALDGTYDIIDVEQGLQDNRFQLFISWNNGIESAVITEIAEYPKAKVLRYVLAGGTNLENWLEEIQEVIEKFAKKNHCTQLEVAGRKGWLKKLKDFKEKAILLSKDL
ncbi:hypothetical protein N9M26_01125 [Alphaproteobacteria bacterium]|jgi:hypothetical protein|nr:hypothetical protein [Alphaproteobacteria bacterium]